jgi:2-oxoglutarate dehydrogenase E2 component (dihydrolipoamide succinyltransferase)
MSTEVVMPQMGESITEGTVSKWLKSVGDTIEKDEPILEISTDKVDAEVPAPGAGILLEIRVPEGETVEVGAIVAVIGEAGEAGAVSSEPPAVSSEPSAVSSEPAPVSSNEQPKTNHVQPTTNNGQSSDATEVVMPQMGESITEGTVSKWLKAVGDNIEKDEPLLEISTDKVDAEVPSPAAGKLLEIRVAEGETVEVGAVVGVVGSGSATPAAKVMETPRVAETPKPVESAPSIQPPVVELRAAAAAASSGDMTLEDLRRTKSSPLVRNIAKEHGIDISRIPGSGASGRVTKNDILNFIETGAALRPQDLLVGKAIAPMTVPQSETVAAKPSAAPPKPAEVPVIAGDRVEPMSVMRRKIAEHMTFSKQTSAHVASVYEIDMTNVAKFRERNKQEFQARYGTKLTFMPFIFQAINQALRKFPVVNSQVSGDSIVYKGDINLGMAVALDWGLIVPVIKKADALSLSGLAVAANDLADRARNKKLMPDEVQGGTFTITNPGVFGGLFGTPIINQPQVAILCVGTIEKRAKVLTTPDGDDYIAIRQMAYFAMTYDHRIVDGADAERFLSFVKQYLETTTFEI